MTGKGLVNGIKVEFNISEECKNLNFEDFFNIFLNQNRKFTLNSSLFQTNIIRQKIPANSE